MVWWFSFVFFFDENSGKKGIFHLGQWCFQDWSILDSVIELPNKPAFEKCQSAGTLAMTACLLPSADR